MKGGAGFGARAKIIYDGRRAIHELPKALRVGILIHGQTRGDHMEELSECFIWVGNWLVIRINLEQLSLCDVGVYHDKNILFAFPSEQKSKFRWQGRG